MAVPVAEVMTPRKQQEFDSPDGRLWRHSIAVIMPDCLSGDRGSIPRGVARLPSPRGQKMCTTPMVKTHTKTWYIGVYQAKGFIRFYFGVIWGRGAIGSAIPLQGKGCGFKSHRFHHRGKRGNSIDIPVKIRPGLVRYLATGITTLQISNWPIGSRLCGYIRKYKSNPTRYLRYGRKCSRKS